jgi:hypothetical protein
VAVAIPQLLQPAVVNDRVSRLKVINTVLQNMLGFGAGGSNVRQSPYGRRGSYDVFNDTREVAGASAPGMPATTIAPQPVGNVPFQIPRINESVALLAELLHNMRPIGGPVSQTDTAGLQYVADQERILKQRITNLREFQCAAALRGSYTYTLGTPFQPFTHGFSGGSITIDFQIPTGNKTKLDMLGAGDILGTSWDNAASPIITDLLQINAAFIQLTGTGLTDLIVTSVGWGYIAANTQVINQGGSANTYFEVISRDEESQTFTVRLRAVPWLTITVLDNGLNLSGTFTKLVEDDHGVFLSRVGGPNVAQYWECSEPVSEWVGQPQTPRFGEYYWVAPTANPTGYQLFSLHNGLPVLKVPAAIAYGLIKY